MTTFNSAPSVSPRSDGFWPPDSAKVICHQFPMRKGSYLAQIVLPRDLSQEEADRLCSFIKALAA